MRTPQAILVVWVMAMSSMMNTVPAMAISRVEPMAAPVEADPSPSANPSPPPSDLATIDIVAIIDPDGPGPKAHRAAVDWKVSIWVDDADENPTDSASVRTDADGRATVAVEVAGREPVADLEIRVPTGFVSLGASCVEVAEGEIVGSNEYESVFFPISGGAHYRCEFVNARATGYVGLVAMYEPDGRYNLRRRIDGDPGWTFDLTVRGGYPGQTVLTSDWEGMTWTFVWLMEGRKTADVDIAIRLPDDARVTEAGCTLGDRRDDGVPGPLPWTVLAHDGRISLTMDRWSSASCIYVIVPTSLVLPETSTAASAQVPVTGGWLDGVLLLAPGGLAGWLAFRRAPRRYAARLVRGPADLDRRARGVGTARL